MLDKLGRDFRKGRAHVDPKDPAKTCRHCELPYLCRISQGTVELEEPEEAEQPQTLDEKEQPEDDRG